MSHKYSKIFAGLTFREQTALPTDPNEGDITFYQDSLKTYLGGQWLELHAGAITPPITIKDTVSFSQNPTSLTFDVASGFILSSQSNDVKVSLGSHFKTIHGPAGQPDIVAVGEDAFSLANGSNITITTDSSTKTVTIATSGGGTVTAVSGSSPLSVSNPTTAPVISMSQANSSTDGFLSQGDWTNFNAKLSSVPNLDASKITSGTFDIARIPPAAIERLVFVANQTARFALTALTVQEGDTVKQLDDNSMWIVLDSANLGNSAGYEAYTASSASSVPWGGITTKPAYVTQAADASHDGYLTQGNWSTFNNKQAALVGGSNGQYLQTTGSSTQWATIPAVTLQQAYQNCPIITTSSIGAVELRGDYGLKIGDGHTVRSGFEASGMFVGGYGNAVDQSDFGIVYGESHYANNSHGIVTGCQNCANGQYLTVMGGSNWICNGSSASSILGGCSNIIAADAAVVIGGAFNSTDKCYSMVGGVGGKAVNTVDFVIGNNQAATRACTNYNHFRVDGVASDVHIGRSINQTAVSGASNALNLHTTEASRQAQYVAVKAAPSGVCSWTMTLPAMVGSSGQYLMTDSSGNTSWTSVNALPAQAGQSGNYLTTNGSAASWSTLATATSSTTGLLTSSDWNTFNGKEPAQTKGSVSTSTTGVTITNGSAATVGPNVTINVATASSSATGLLSSSDWNTFNSKATTATASSSATGLLSSSDWNTFNGKEPAQTKGSVSTSTTGVTITNGSAATVGPNTTINVATATSSATGLLSSSDWNTFNSKATTATASSSATGLLSSSDWNTFNSKLSSVPNLDASKITSGIFDIARIPAAALERLVIVANQAARYALTIATVQLGDTVKQSDDSSMWMVVDTANLGNSAGYEPYTAATASAVAWTGVTGKPAYVTQVATSTSDGYLSAANWSTFNSKEPAQTKGNVSTSTTGVTITNGSASTVGPNVTVNIATAGSSTAGLLLSSDWNIFNNKQSAIIATLKNEFVDSPYSLMTPNISATDSASKYATLTGAAFSTPDKTIVFSANGQSATSINMLDSVEFLPSALDVGSVDLSVFWSKGSTYSIPAAFTYNVSRDGGNNYFPVTMSQVGSTETFRGSLRFDTTATTESTKVGLYAQATQDNGRDLTGNSTNTRQKIAQPFTVSAPSKLQEVKVYMKAGSGTPTGYLTVSVVNDNAGSPGTTVLSQSNGYLISSLGLTTSYAQITLSIPNIVVLAGTYHVVISTDAAYKTGYDTSANNAVLIGDKQTSPSTPYEVVHDGTAWSIASPNGSMAVAVNGRPLDLRVQVVSAGAPTYPCGLDGYGIFYNLQNTGVVGAPKKTQRFTINSTDNTSTFNVTSFTPDSDLLSVYVAETGQVFKSPAFIINGSSVQFPANTFNNGGVSTTYNLIFDQNSGGALSTTTTTVIPSTLVQGRTDGVTPSAGMVGELISVAASAVTASGYNSVATIASYSLPAGNWRITAFDSAYNDVKPSAGAVVSGGMDIYDASGAAVIAEGMNAAVNFGTANYGDSALFQEHLTTYLNFSGANKTIQFRVKCTQVTAGTGTPTVVSRGYGKLMFERYS